jgi:hypothetical protein
MPKRKTITFDDDVHDRLVDEAQRNGETFRAALNRILRRGFHPRPPAGKKRFKVRGPFARAKPGVSFDKIEELLDQIEGPWRR